MKNRVNLKDLKSPYYLEQTFSYACGLGIDLKKSGAFYVASCPFHSDTKPSFYLHDKKGKVRFTCFSPFSAVQNLKVNYISGLCFKSGDFLHYIFNYLGSVGQKYFHSLEQNLQFF